LLKRTLDVIASATLLLVTAPLIVAIAIAIKVATPGPIFYRGSRVGRHGCEFHMLKFRTMVVGADRAGASSTADDDVRLTPVGRVLRRFKLDELPQLWNVLVGDMSLVGPRPQVPWAVERYSDDEKILLTVRPGITDPASLYFSNEGEILRGHQDPERAYFELIHPEKMRRSIEYVKTRSFIGDVKIIASTAGTVFGWRPAGRQHEGPDT
jgi:lipopolysaccharide/colanic/teichoic acid biosynthesis glycosyltransferase